LKYSLSNFLVIKDSGGQTGPLILPCPERRVNGFYKDGTGRNAGSFFQVWRRRQNYFTTHDMQPRILRTIFRMLKYSRSDPTEMSGGFLSNATRMAWLHIKICFGYPEPPTDKCEKATMDKVHEELKQLLDEDKITEIKGIYVLGKFDD
jgi:hypothetical protein